MGTPDTDRASDAHCLECGAVLPAGTDSCEKCGNTRLILPSRWAPDEDGERKPSLHLTSPALRLGHEARTLVGLSLALLCALMLLAGARRSTEARLTSGEMRIPPQPCIEVPQPSLPPPSEPVTTAGNPEALRQEAILAQDRGSWAEAASLWAQITSDPGSSMGDFLALAQAAQHAGDFQGAVSALRKAQARFPGQPEPYLILARLLEENGDPESARHELKLGLSSCPDNSDLAQALARLDAATRRPGTIEGQPLPSPPRQVTPSAANPAPQPVAQPRVSPPATDDGRTTLIGDPGQPSVPPDNHQDGTRFTPQASVEISDISVEATADQVTITLTTTGPPELSSRKASDPPRLILRLPGTRIAPGASVPNNLAINVPLIDRVAVAQTTDDTMLTVVLIVYLGQDTRYWISSDARTVRVTVVKSDSPVGE